MNEHEDSEGEEKDGTAHGRPRRHGKEARRSPPGQAATPVEPTEDRTAQPAEPARAPLDPMFPQLVRESETPEQKLIGFIAYGLYEEARREWASEFREREGRYPGPDELRAYERSWTASRLDGIRNAAIQVVAAYADSVVTQVEADILRRALRGGFWRSVARWLFSAVVFGLVLLGIVVALGRFGIDPIQAVRDLATPSRTGTPGAGDRVP